MARKGKISEVFSLDQLEAQQKKAVELVSEFVDVIGKVKPIAIKLQGAEKTKEVIDGIKNLGSATTTLVDKYGNVVSAINGVEKSSRQLAIILKEDTKASKDNEAATVNLAKSQKLLAEAKVQEAKAAKEQAQAEAIRTKSIIDQEKELDRQIAKEEKLAKQKKATDFSQGSQEDIRKQRSELNALLIKRTEGETINFRGQLLSYDEAIKKLQELSFAEQDFRRQFQKDGTLVGEYASGIVNAFDRLKISDILKDDINKGKQQLSELEKKTNELVVAYRRAQQEGSGDFDRLRKDIHDNVVETETLRKSIQANEAQLASMGGTGSKITETIKEQFKSLKNGLTQFALGYFGLQAAFSGGQKLFRLNFDFQDSVNELKAITGVAGKDLEYLKQQALDTSSKTQFSSKEILESFKLIASAKPELLQNVEALNQIKDAAIVLAQASGQSLPEAVDSLTKVLNQFGAEADQSAKFIDALAAGAKFGAAEIPAVTQALLEFGTQAKSSNISVQESIGLIELLAEKGIQGAEAGTKLRNVLLALNAADALPKDALSALSNAGVDIKKLSDNTIPLEDRLRELSKVAGDSSALVKIFGKENFNAAQIVLQNIPRYAQLAAQIKEVGVAQEQSNDNTNSASVAWAKLRNQFENLLTSENVTKFLAGLAATLSFLIGHLGVAIPLVITAIGLTNNWAGSLVRLTAAYTLQAAAWTLEKAQLIANNAIRATATFLMNVYTAATIRSATATGAAAVAYRILAAAIALFTSPLGIAVGLLAVFTTAIGIFAAKAGEASNATGKWVENQKDLVAQQKITNDLQAEVQKQTSATKDKIHELVGVITSATASYEEKKKALDKLIAIAPDYLSGLTLENTNTEEGISIINRYVKALDQMAEAKARVNLKAKFREQQLDTQTSIDALKAEQAQTPELSGVQKFFFGADGKLFGQGDRNRYDVDQDLQKKQAENDEIARKLKALDAGTQKQINDLRKGIDEKTARLKTLDAGGKEAKQLAQDIQADQATLFTLQGIDPNSGATGTSTGTDGATQTLEQLKAQLKKINAQIKQIDLIKNKSSEQIAQLKTLRKQRDEIARQIREIEGKRNPAAEKAENRDAKAQFELSKLEIEDRIKAQKTIADSDIAFSAVRAQARMKQFEEERALIIAERDFELSNSKLTKNERLLIETKAARQLVELERQTAMDIVSIRRNLNESIEAEATATEAAMAPGDKADRDKKKGFLSGELDDRLQRVQNNANAELKTELDKYTQGKISKEQYEEAKAKIEAKAHHDSILAQIKYYEDLIRLVHLPEDEEKAALKELNDYKQQLYDADVKAQEDANNRKGKSNQGFFKKYKDQLKELGNELEDAVFSILEGGIDRQKNAIQEQIDGLDKQKAKDIEVVNQTVVNKQQAADQIAVIEARANAQKEQLEQRQRKLDQEKAKFERARTIAGIIQNTAQGVTAALAEFPPNPVLAAIVGAIGAAQLVKVLATPLPKYKEGTEDHKGGLALVGDGGTKEYVQTPDGTIYETPDTDTVVDLPKHSRVFKDEFALMDAMHRQHVTSTTHKMERMPNDFYQYQTMTKKVTKSIERMEKNVVKAIENAPQPVIETVNPVKKWVHSGGTTKFLK